jgi:hypothetical protein
MLRFECDNCQRLKGAGEAWILGFAAENVGAVSARREVTILNEWDEARAVDWLAVHFCSDECRAEYMEQLFGDEVSEQIHERKIIPVKKVRLHPVQTEVVRTVPDRGLVRTSARAKTVKRTAPKAKRGRKRRAA